MHSDLVGERTQRIGGKHRSAMNNSRYHFSPNYEPRRLKPEEPVGPRTQWPAEGDTGVLRGDEVQRLLAERPDRALVAVPVARPVQPAETSVLALGEARVAQAVVPSRPRRVPSRWSVRLRLLAGRVGAVWTRGAR